MALGKAALSCLEPVAGDALSAPAKIVILSSGLSLAVGGIEGALLTALGKDRFTVVLNRTDPPPHPEPWGLELAEGAKCRIRNGGAWGGRADDFVGTYFCDRDNEFVLVPQTATENVNTSGKAWTVQVGGLADPDSVWPPPTTVRVVTAYFATS